ncbi:DNA polymerase alpha subunit B-like [Haliotis rufescens]|uniref:DNA polymerase alpha subunit B-like n=1 Tax=Haliotis rufescens TaxID=6454 RepID=UPI00201F19C3|nr:DNA polymerase alpha subunit B-like [Haliotis rufescens]
MTSVSEEDLVEEFDTFDIDLTQPEVIDKLKELCIVHRLEAAKMAAEWMAFSCSAKRNLNLDLGSLDSFERERLSKKAKVPKAPPSKKGPVLYDINTIEDGIDEEDAANLLGAYTAPGTTPKGNLPQKRQHTPENLPMKRFSNAMRSPVPFSPRSFSPASVTPSRKYSTRTNAGDVVCSFGPTDNISWQGQGQGCSVAPFDSTCHLTSQFKHMFQKLTDKAHILNDLIEDMSAELQNKHGIEEYSHVALPNQDQVTVSGRIGCDSNGKLNAKSVVLEGSRESSAGKCIPVDLSSLKEYSLFPGQLVALDGSNTTGQKFVVTKLYENSPLPTADMKVKQEIDAPLTVMIASGPFTTSDTLTYEPLDDLMKYLQRDRPDICILLGPFVDVKNEEIEKGSVTCTFEEIFQRNIGQVAAITERMKCKLIVVPSGRDVHHSAVYPQPPLQMNVKNFEAKNVMFVSDPCTLQINNTVFGITSTDVLFHLGQEEISFPPGSADRLGRLAQHMLCQHSYYPLYPPHEDVNVDYDHFEVYGRMPVTPHVLVVPSDLRYFVKDVKGCCVVNPGRVAKGQVGGTYCRLVLPSNATDNKQPTSTIAAQVLRV